MKSFWNERYKQAEYVYGEYPNVYFRQQLEKLSPGKLLLPAEGEGRNAVFAASLGWEVTAFDQSEEGKKKAEALARQKGISIRYDLLECADMSFSADTFDAIALIYAHFPAGVRTLWHHQFTTYLKPGGYMILEAFSKAHHAHQLQNPNAGGPGDIGMLYSATAIQHDFENLEPLELIETEIALSEGQYHFGNAAVVRFTGRKKYTS